MEPVILASSSPRRQEILKNLNIPFRVMIPNIDESMFNNVPKEEIPELLAREKVSAIIHSLPPQQEIQWILGADTLIFCDDEVIGKPEDQDQAFEVLKKLQGRTHYVETAIVLYNGRTKQTTSKICKTAVTFSEMTDNEIQWYVETGEWHGAAGGYRIQGMASCFIKRIEGSFSCVVGLPISELYDILKEQNYSILV